MISIKDSTWLGKRAKAALLANGIHDLSICPEFPRRHFLAMKGIGRMGAWEIEKELAERGLSFLSGEYGFPKESITKQEARLQSKEKYERKSRHVYFVQPDGHQVVKIGICGEHPMGRLQALQVGCWESLRVIGLLKDGTLNMERQLHEKFYRHHIRGEWFRLDAEILAFIKENCL